MKVNSSTKCEKCNYGYIDDSNKAKVIVHCSKKNKDYFYGQRINCEDADLEKE